MLGQPVEGIFEITYTWGRYVGPDAQHVIPNADLHPHDLSSGCWCKPEEDLANPIDGRRWIHNAADGREDYESGDRLHN
jgi:hypothetical protein